MMNTSIKTCFNSKAKLLCLLLALLLSVSFSRAGSHTWSGAINGYWSLTGNWSSGGAPVAGEADVRLAFPAGATRSNTTNNVGALTVASLTLSGDNYALRGNFALTFQGAGGLNVLGSGTNNSVASPLVLSGNVGITVGTDDDLAFDAQITGPGSLTKFGEGTLALRPMLNNSWGGGTTVRDGRLHLFSQSSLPTTVIPGPLVIGATNNPAFPVVQLWREDQIADGAAVTIHTNAAFNLGGHSETIGSLTMVSGQVDPGLFGSGALRLNGPFTGSGSSYVGADVMLNGETRTFTIVNGATVLQGNVLDGVGGAGGILKTGPGRLLLANSNSFTGPVTVNQGVVQINHAHALGSTIAGTTVNDGGTLSVLGGLTVSGEGLGLNGAGDGGQGALRAGGNGSTWAGPMGLGTDAVVTVPNPAHAFAISSGISGFGRFIKQGPGVLVFSGSQANTCAGGVQVDAGTLNMQKLPGVNSVVQQLRIGGTNDALGSAVVQVFSDNQIADSTAVFVDYSGKLDLGVKSDTIGSLTIRAGQVTTSLGTLTLNGDMTTLMHMLNDEEEWSYITGKLSLGNATRTITVHGMAEIDAVISGAGSAGITMVGDDYLFLGGDNTYPGITTVASGGLVAGSDTALGSTNSGTIVLSGTGLFLEGERKIVGESLSIAGGLVTFGTNEWTGPVTVTGAANFVVNDGVSPESGLFILSSSLHGNGALGKFGVGRLVLAGTNGNTLSGPLTVAHGELLLAKTNPVSTRAIAGPLVIGTTNASPRNVIVRHLAPGQFGPSVVVSVLPTGRLDLNGFSDSVAGLNLMAGDVTTGTGKLSLMGPVVADAFEMKFSTLAGQVVLNDGQQLFRTTNYAYVEIPASLMDNGIGGIGGMFITGDGLVVLDGTNTFQGPVEVNAGTLYLNSSRALGATLNGTIVTNDARLILNADNLEIAGEDLSLRGGAGLDAQFVNYGSNSVWAGPIKLEGMSWIASVRTNSSLELRGPISGSGGFVGSSKGFFLLSGSEPNTYTGVTEFLHGTLLLSKTNAIAVAGPLHLSYGAQSRAIARLLGLNQIANTARVSISTGYNITEIGQLDLNDFSEVIGSLAGAGEVNLGTAQLTVGGDDTSTTFNGYITGQGATGLVKTGTGAFTFYGTGQHSGTTLVSAGTLIVNGSLENSAVTVAASGAIGGNGYVKTLTVNGAVRPGPDMSAPCYGLLHSFGGVNLAPGSHYYCELGGLTPGSKCDQLQGNGAVVLNNVILNLSENFTPAVSNKFTILDIPIGGIAMGNFVGLPEGAQFSISPGRTFQITYRGGDGNDVVLTQVTIPEPAHLTGITKSPLGPSQVNAVGTPSLGYDVYATTDVASTNWVKLGNVTADNDGLLQFLDENSLVLPMRFYRFALP